MKIVAEVRKFFLEEMTLEKNFEVKFFYLSYFWLCRTEVFRLYQNVLWQSRRIIGKE